MSGQIVTYACGSPIRQKLMYSIAKGFDSDLFNPFPGPDYLGGTAIVWGLIRGARELMEKAADSEQDFYQIDNGYFGRNQYFRISKNALQKTQITAASKTRSAQVLASCGITLPKGVTGKKGSKILVALSSENLYAFHGQTSRQWLISTIESITQFSDREIEIRSKNSSKPLAQDLDEAWCVVTHSSAVALDALQRNIPVICTSRCAASPLSMRFSDIESPKIDGSVEELFLSLAESQFTLEEYRNGVARESVLLVSTEAEPQITNSKFASTSYVAEQIRLHKKPSYGSTSRLFAKEIAELIHKTDSRSVLDFGAGKCRLKDELTALGVNVIYKPYDIAFPEYGQPTLQDFVVCVDVLEHVEPHFLDDVITELFRCARKLCFVSVHTGPARKHLSDGRNAHLIQEPWEWWKSVFEKKFSIVNHGLRNDGFTVWLSPGVKVTDSVQTITWSNRSPSIDAVSSEISISPQASAQEELNKMSSYASKNFAEENRTASAKYPINPTVFDHSAFQESYYSRDFFFCADGDGQYPQHHCKMTWNIAKQYLKGYRSAVDIGCRDGEFTRYLSSVYEMTYCFDPRVMQRFADNVDLSKVCHFGCALGNTNERIEMSGGQHDLSRGKRYFVDCFKLDDFQFDRIDLIKIDVEGYEERVVLGAMHTLDKCRPVVIIEQNHVTLAGEPKFKALSLLKRLGYREVARDPRGWDFVMIRD